MSANSLLISLSSQRTGRADAVAELGATASATTWRCRRRSTASIRWTRCCARRSSRRPNAVNTNTPTSLAGTANAEQRRGGRRPEPGFRWPTAIPGRIAGSTAAALEPGRRVSAASAPEIVNHYNVQPVFDVYANVDRRDLGSVGAAVEKIMDEMTPKLPRGTTLDLRGQVSTMQTSFYRLGLGMIFAVVLVYLLMAVNFQSWLDPFIILMALPGALAGIVWMLFVTQTTFSVPSLMGAIMCIGVATANSILMVVFANDQRVEGMDAARGGAGRRAYAHPPGADDGRWR